MINWMQSLSEPTRARVLRLLERTELTVADLCSTLQLPQSTVSRHLKVLGDEGWISSRRDGTSNFYRMIATNLEAGQKKLWQVVKPQSVLEATADQDDLRLDQVLALRRSRSQEFFSSSVDKWDKLKGDLFGSRLDAWTLGALVDSRSIFGDFGCGTGSIAQLVAPWVQQVIAIDNSSTMVQAAKKRLREFSNVEIRKGELDDLPLEDGLISLGLASLVLPYTANPRAAVREMSRVVSDQGELILVDMLPHDRSEYRDLMGHLWMGFSQEQITEWLQEAGWDRIQFHSLPPDPDAKGSALFVVKAACKR